MWGLLLWEYPNLQRTTEFLCTTNSTLCLKINDTDVAHYNFDADQLILIIFGRDVADRECYQTVICHPTFPN